MNIKLTLDEAESAPVERLAEVLDVKPEDALYAARSRLMMHARKKEPLDEIVRPSPREGQPSSALG